MIKCVRIGDQIEKGKDQLMFVQKTCPTSNPIIITIDHYGKKPIFDSWDKFDEYVCKYWYGKNNVLFSGYSAIGNDINEINVKKKLELAYKEAFHD